MKINFRSTIRAAALLSLLPALCLGAPEPLLGHWVLASTEVGGQKAPSEDMLLRVTPVGATFEFAYSVPLNNIQFVAVRYAVRLDGSEADVTGSNGKKMGTVKITKAGPAQYKMVLEGPNKPTASGTMTVSSDGKTLTSISESTLPGQTAVTRMVQVYTRQP